MPPGLLLRPPPRPHESVFCPHSCAGDWPTWAKVTTVAVGAVAVVGAVAAAGVMAAAGTAAAAYEGGRRMSSVGQLP